MTRDETRALLIQRRNLTNESFSDATIDAWHAALATHELADLKPALARAARQQQRIAVAHVLELIPHRPPPEPEPEPREAWCTCSDTICAGHRQLAARELARIRARMTAPRGTVRAMTTEDPTPQPDEPAEQPLRPAEEEPEQQPEPDDGAEQIERQRNP